MSQKNDVNDIALLRSPNAAPMVQSKEKSKTLKKKTTPNSRTKLSEIHHEEAAIVPYGGGHQGEQIVVSEQFACNSTLSGHIFEIYCRHD